jgi:hypothetical protein
MTEEELMKVVKSLYTERFRLELRGMYIYSGDHMVADFSPINPYFRPRGYGRMKYMNKGDAVHDMHHEYLMKVVEGHETDPTKCCELLNLAWGFTKE